MLGRTNSEKCVVRLADNRIRVDGDHEVFLGYKVGHPVEGNGIFTEWSVKDDIFSLENDQFGMFPVFYRKGQDSLSVATSLSDLIDPDDLNELDDPAIAVFLRMGSFLGDSTPFKKIKSLPPGAKLQFSKEGFSLEKRRISTPEKSALSFSRAQEVYCDLFQAAVEKFDVASLKVGLPLSGGRDSRHILFAMISAGMEPHSCMTLRHQAPKNDEDVEIARKICDFAQINHEIIHQPLSFLHSEIEKNQRTNFCSLEHSWILPLSQYLQDNEYDAIFDGIAGGMLSDGSFLTRVKLELYRKGRFRALAEEVLGDEGYLPKMLEGRAYQRFERALALDLVARELEVHADAPNPVSQFYFWNRTRRHISMSTWSVLSQKCQVFAPYLDQDVYTFLSSLPGEFFFDKRFHGEAIQNYYPRYAHLPYEAEDGPPQKKSRVVSWYQLFDFLCYFVRMRQDDSLCNPLFVYPRIAKGFISSDYYNRSKTMYKIPVYLNELLRLAKAETW
ncbi:asparagine synthase-related protein [Desulfogranum mediterraneum]|uniref:asparagine synthase-related protein n=1 Tax=Desulfogranum mediterraneum TaxID=160661 RepID=UPI000426634B|nr:asparagine synthase-related protein [Desulfogranum mediterraneum]